MMNCQFCPKSHTLTVLSDLSPAFWCSKNSFIPLFLCIDTLMIGQVNTSSSLIDFGGNKRSRVNDVRGVRPAKRRGGSHGGGEASCNLKVYF